MKKFLIKFLILLLIVITPIAGFFIYGECIQEDVYQDTYYAELKDKVDRLSSRENKKIVFIGGSSLIFGLRSEEIEKATGYDVVDFGLYASLGTPLMMKIAEDYIKEGDIVVLAPEINADTYKNYVAYDVALKCFENADYKVGDFSIDENAKFFFNYFRYVIEKGNASIELQAPYDKASFNEYCDIDNEIVANNIVEGYYDPSQMITPSKDIVDESFVDYVNEYYESITKKGAKMFFSFSPTNYLAYNGENIEQFNAFLSESLKVPLLGSVSDFVYHQYYFYDTNFHLNKAGSYLHSKNLSNLLRKELNIENEYEIEVPNIPQPMYYDSDEIVTIDDMQFRQVFSVGKYSYRLVGLSDSKKDITEFRVPSSVNGVPVTSMNCPFNNMPNLRKVIIPKEVTTIQNKICSNCPNLIGVYLEHQNPPSVPAMGMLDGASPDALIYVLKQYAKNYTSGYTWLEYRDLIKTYEN